MNKIILGFLFLIIIGCQMVNRNGFVVVDLVTTMDMNVDKGRPNYKETFSTKVISYGNLDAYIIGSERQHTIYELQQKTGEIKERRAPNDTVYTYYIVEKGKQYGLKFDSLSAKAGIRFDIDSLNQSINLGKQNREVFTRNGDSLTYSLHDPKTGKLLIEKYVQNTNEYDSIYRYYDYEMRDIEYAISPVLDRRAKSKLIKIGYITNPKLVDGSLMNREEFSISLRRSTFDKLDQLKKLFELFEKEREILK